MQAASSLNAVYEVRREGQSLGSYGLYSLKNRFLQGHLDPEVEIALKGTEVWQPAWEVIQEARSVRQQRQALSVPIPEEARVLLSQKEGPAEAVKRRLISGLVIMLGPVLSLGFLGALVFGFTSLVGRLSVSEGSAGQALQAALQGDTKGLYHDLHGSLFSAAVKADVPMGPGRPDLLMAYLLEAKNRAHADVVNVMLEAGARVETAWEGQTPMSLALKQLPEDRGKLLLLLIEHGADVDSVLEGSTPLLEAVRFSPQDDGALMRKLLQAGADPGFAPPSAPARTPVAAALEVLSRDQGKALSLLILQGAKISDTVPHELLTGTLLEIKDDGVLLKQAIEAGLRIPESFWRPDLDPGIAAALARLFPEEAARRHAAQVVERKP